jgi:hypothetical protein
MFLLGAVVGAAVTLVIPPEGAVTTFLVGVVSAEFDLVDVDTLRVVAVVRFTAVIAEAATDVVVDASKTVVLVGASLVTVFACAVVAVEVCAFFPPPQAAASSASATTAERPVRARRERICSRIVPPCPEPSGCAQVRTNSACAAWLRDFERFCWAVQPNRSKTAQDL